MRATVGQIVLYYQNGVRSNAPRPAMVMQATDNNSVLGLNVFPEQGGTMFYKRCVYCIRDPHIVKNPAVAMSYGAWDHMGPAPVPPEAPAPSPAAVHSPPAPVDEEPASTGDAQADLMNKLLSTAGK